MQESRRERHARNGTVNLQSAVDKSSQPLCLIAQNDELVSFSSVCIA